MPKIGHSVSDKTMKINEFRRLFAERVLQTISPQGYVYKKSREVFERIEGEHISYIYVYMYKRSTFIEIETRTFYANKAIARELKERGIQLPYERFCGGGIKFICSYYFKKDFPERYSDLIFMLDENPDRVIDDWLGYFESIMMPFLEDCKNPKSLNHIVNNLSPIGVPGLNATYETRVLYAYFVGKRAGLSEKELLALLGQYEEALKSDDCDYIDQFLKLKQELFNQA